MRYLVGLMIVFSPLVGVFFIMKGVRRLYTAWRRRPFLKSAEAVVVGTKTKSVSDMDCSEPQHLYRPILQFTTERGELRQFVSETGKIASESPFRRGDRLPVLYDPDGVLQPLPDSWYALWGYHLFLAAIVGPGFIGCSVFLCLAFGQRVLHGD
jgi:hypothetical protein